MYDNIILNINILALNLNNKHYILLLYILQIQQYFTNIPNIMYTSSTHKIYKNGQ